MLPGGVGGILYGDPGGADGGHGECQEARDHAASAPVAATCGVVSRAEERFAGRG